MYVYAVYINGVITENVYLLIFVFWCTVGQDGDVGTELEEPAKCKESTGKQQQDTHHRE